MDGKTGSSESMVIRSKSAGYGQASRLSEENYNKQVISKELTEVVRQKKDSLILENATRIRKKISLNGYKTIKNNFSAKEMSKSYYKFLS